MLVCYLQKALYSLKQTPRVWYTLILEFLQELKFTKTDADYNVFVFHDKLMFISIYMNDFLIISKDLNIINGLKNNLSKYFYITNLGYY